MQMKSASAMNEKGLSQMNPSARAAVSADKKELSFRSLG